MGVENLAGKSLNWQQLAALVELVFKKPRPMWAKMAAARLLHLIMPNLTARRWMECFEAPDPIEKLNAICEFPWFLGRMARVLAEWKTAGQADPAAGEQFKPFQYFTIGESEILLGQGPGVEGLLLTEIQKVLQEPLECQKRFWPAFASGFERDLKPRPQDLKAVEIYWFLAAHWDTATPCKSVRDLYALVSQNVTIPPCPANVDPVDFEERQFKWFEKLCHRNLHVSFGRRGRPPRK